VRKELTNFDDAIAGFKALRDFRPLLVDGAKKMVCAAVA